MRKLPVSSSVAGAADSQSAAVDVLPEVLRHSLPPKIFRQQPLSASSSPTSAAGPSSLLLAPIPAFRRLLPMLSTPSVATFPCPRSPSVPQGESRFPTNDLFFLFHGRHRSQVGPEDRRSPSSPPRLPSHDLQVM